MKNCLIIFAREPEKGKVKTRLQAYLSKEQCLELYKAFLKDTFALVKKINYTYKVLAYDSSAGTPCYLKRIARGFTFYKQKGKDLGEKIHNAFTFAKETYSAKTVIIGSDSPNLPAEYIKKAFKLLDAHDMVLGPSVDGGYYLVGLKKPCMGIFQDIKWSSAKVCDNTFKNAKRLNKKTALLSQWYDIDDSIGLAFLKRDLSNKKNSAFYSKELLKV